MRKHNKIKESICRKQKNVFEFRHCPIAPRAASCGTKAPHSGEPELRYDRPNAPGVSPALDTMDDSSEKARDAGAAQEIHAFTGIILVFCITRLIDCETIEQSVAARAAQIGLRTATIGSTRRM